MRPIGVTIIAIWSWLWASLFALVGLMLIGVGHLSARLVATVASDSLVERLVSGVGKALGIGGLIVAAMFVAAGIGLWALKNWGRTLAVALAGIWLLFGLLGLARHAGTWHLTRTLVDLAIVVYLMLPDVKRSFSGA